MGYLFSGNCEIISGIIIGDRFIYYMGLFTLFQRVYCVGFQTAFGALQDGAPFAPNGLYTLAVNAHGRVYAIKGNYDDRQ